MEYFKEVGYKVVYADTAELSDLLDIPTSKGNTKLAPLIVRMRSGYDAVWLEIESSKLKRHLDKTGSDYKQYIDSLVGKRYMKGMQYLDGGMLTDKELE